MPPFMTSMFARITQTAIGYILALFVIGGADRIAQEYNITPAQKALAVIDTAVVQQRTLFVAPGSTVAVSGTVVNAGPDVSATAL